MLFFPSLYGKGKFSQGVNSCCLGPLISLCIPMATKMHMHTNAELPSSVLTSQHGDLEPPSPQDVK